MNNVVLTGRLVADPVVVTSNKDTKVTKYTLAVQRSHRHADGKQPTADFVSCTTFGRVAEFAICYLRKGMKIGIVGRLQSGSYEKDGVRRYTTEVIVRTHEFLESKRVAITESTESDAPQEFSSDDGDEKLPF